MLIYFKHLFAGLKTTGRNVAKFIKIKCFKYFCKFQNHEKLINKDVAKLSCNEPEAIHCNVKHRSISVSSFFPRELRKREDKLQGRALLSSGFPNTKKRFEKPGKAIFFLTNV